MSLSIILAVAAAALCILAFAVHRHEVKQRKIDQRLDVVTNGNWSRMLGNSQPSFEGGIDSSSGEGISFASLAPQSTGAGIETQMSDLAKKGSDDYFFDYGVGNYSPFRD